MGKSTSLPPLFFSGREILALIRWEGKNPRQALCELRRQGLPHTCRINNRFLYPRKAVLAWLRSRESKWAVVVRAS